MSRRILALFLLIPIFGFSSSYQAETHLKDPSSSESKTLLTDLGAEPTAIVAGCVNVISGDFIDQGVDLTIPGPEPFNFARSYSSGDVSIGSLWTSWHHNHHGSVYLETTKDRKPYQSRGLVLGSFGERLYFDAEKKLGDKDFAMVPSPDFFKHGTTNLSRGAISGQSDPRNTRLLVKHKDQNLCAIQWGSAETHEYKPTKENKFIYALYQVKKPSGMKFKYSYSKEGDLESCVLHNRLKTPISHFNVSSKIRNKDENWLTIQAPDGRTAQYCFRSFGKEDKRICLTHVVSPDGPSISYDYEKADYKIVNDNLQGHLERIAQKNFPEGRFLGVKYYEKGENIVFGSKIKIDSYNAPLLNRVKELKAPVGVDGSAITTHSFQYYVPPGKQYSQTTGVYDALGNKTDYNYNPRGRLTNVIKFLPGNTPYTIEELYWGKEDTEREITLKARSFGLISKPFKTYAKKFIYDLAGNLISDEIYGPITGTNFAPLHVDSKGHVQETGCERKVKTYTYSQDGWNLLTSITEETSSRHFQYVPGSNLLAACFYKGPEGIYQRYFYEYDANAMITKSTIDDGKSENLSDLSGVSRRTIEFTRRSEVYPVGLPLEVRYCYLDLASGEIKLIRKEENHFDPKGRLILQKTYDENDLFAFAKEYRYDNFGSLIYEKNALGHEISRAYDVNGNLIKELGPLEGFSKTMKYDFSNRLITLTEHHPDGDFTQHFSYDLLGNQVRSIDAFGRETHTSYDCFGRVIQETLPKICLDGAEVRPSTTYAYDELSNPIRVTDAKGRSIETAFTIFGKPYRVTYPDGSTEHFEYNLRNQLVKETSKNGLVTVYIRDIQDRITKKEIFSPDGTLLKSNEWGYSTFDLLFEKDPEGNLTTYTYDYQGRKTSVQCGDYLTQFEYDHLGRVIKTISCESVVCVKYNALDQITLERHEDLEGNILKQERYFYDALGRKIQVEYGDGASQINEFDTHGNLLKSIDPEGNITISIPDYKAVDASGERVFSLTIINPKGVQEKTLYDTRGKVAEITLFSPFHVTLHKKKIEYDILGNRTKIHETPFFQGKARTTQTTLLEYDLFNRLIRWTEALGSCNEKQTSTTYNIYGEKESVVKADGVKILHLYDILGRLSEISTSDGTLHNRTHYDKNNHPILTENLLNGKSTSREYNSLNQLIAETLQNGITTNFSYTPDGKISAIHLLDESSIQYDYQGFLLKACKRYSNEGGFQYEHLYTQYNLKGQILKEAIPFELGETKREYSPKGHLKSMSSSYFSETGSYDSMGNLIARTLTDSIGLLEETYEYDELNQLTKENGAFSHEFGFDSLHNRLMQDGNQCETNDLNQLLSVKEKTYTYDLNGNLIQESGPEGVKKYNYDALDRLIQIITPDHTLSYVYDEQNRCIAKNSEGTESRYFYLGQAELGAVNDENVITELQVLGKGFRSEPCRAVAIELLGVPYIPIQDQSGHVRTLVDQSGATLETYRYSSFGECLLFSKISLNNPYRFAGKRFEAESGLIQFGRRFYSPEMGRFITKDPAGIDISPNLYAYLKNCPLAHYDAFGLFETSDLTHQVQEVAKAVFMGLRTGIVGAAKAASYTFRTLGNALYISSWHLIPLPIVKDAPMAAGYFLSRGNFDGYTLSINEPDSHYFIEGLKKTLGIAHMSGNGMCTPLDAAKVMAKSVSEAYGGERVVHVYAATHGLVRDLGEVTLQMLGVRTHQVKVTEEATRVCIEEAGGIGKGHYVTADFHSRGGLCLSKSKDYLAPEEQKMLWIATYGSAKIIDSRGVARVTNYISTGDYVPLIGDTVNYCKAALFGDPSVQFVDALESGFDHGFCGKTYQSALKNSVNKFNEFLRER